MSDLGHIIWEWQNEFISDCMCAFILSAFKSKE